MLFKLQGIIHSFFTLMSSYGFLKKNPGVTGGGGSTFKMIKMSLMWHINFFLLLQVLLDLASLIFEEQQSLEVILKKIAATIISFMQVQKCTIFIVDEDCSVSTDPDCILNWLIVNCVNGKVCICTITYTGSASASWTGQQLLISC